MINRKKKICVSCNTEQYIFSKGKCNTCYLKDKKYSLSSFSPINKENKKTKERREKYKAIAKALLEKNPNCEICKVALATDIHHKENRLGDNLYNNLMCLCRNCHQDLHLRPKWAKENGYLI